MPNASARPNTTVVITMAIIMNEAEAVPWQSGQKYELTISADGLKQ